MNRLSRVPALQAAFAPVHDRPAVLREITLCSQLSVNVLRGDIFEQFFVLRLKFYWAHRYTNRML